MSMNRWILGVNGMPRGIGCVTSVDRCRRGDRDRVQFRSESERTQLAAGEECAVGRGRFDHAVGSSRGRAAKIAPVEIGLTHF